MRESGLPWALPTHWRWWEDGAHDGATNMAADQALLATVRPGVGSWRWYEWARPTVSFGRHERVTGRYSADALSDGGYDAVRRPTGGRALLHWRELTYSVALPLPAAAPWRRAYDAINVLLLDMLHRLGVQAQLADAGAALLPDGPVCFERPSEGEIIVGGQKLVGSAVWRQGDAYLQHGSILLHDDQGQLATLVDRASGATAAAAAPASATLASCLPHHSDDTLRRMAYDAARDVIARCGSVTSFVHTDEWRTSFALQHRHFADPSWLWRR